MRETAAVRALARVGSLGDQPQLRLISALLFVAGVSTGNGRLARTAARMLIAHELATGFKSFVKHRVDRTRPRSARSTEQKQIKPGHSHAKELSSFPSGHSSGAVAVARAYIREYPEHSAAATAAAGIIMGAQISSSAHYLSDVVAGAFIGGGAEVLSSAAFPYMIRTSTKPMNGTKMPQTATLYRMVLPYHVCPYGLAAREMLEEHGYTIDEHLLRSREAVDEFMAQHDLDTTPLVIIDGQTIGGSDDLERYLTTKI